MEGLDAARLGARNHAQEFDAAGRALFLDGHLNDRLSGEEYMKGAAVEELRLVGGDQLVVCGVSAETDERLHVLEPLDRDAIMARTSAIAL